MYDRLQQVGACNSATELEQSSLRRLAQITGGDGPRTLAAPVPNGRSEMASALEQQEKATYDLMEVVRMLADKLSPVLVPRPETGGSSAGEPAYGSQIATCLQTNTHQIRAASEMLARLVRDLAV